jgi:hypothetical protein
VTSRNAIASFGVATLGIVGVALAASPRASVGVAPDTPKAHSILSVAVNRRRFTGLPSGMTLTLQKGFKSSAASVPVLCNRAKVPPTGPSSCPTRARIGTGVTVYKYANVTLAAAWTLYLGNRLHTADIASIVLSARVGSVTQNDIGRLFENATTGAIEIVFTKLPHGPRGASLESLGWSALAFNGGSSLFTNPPICGTDALWSGSFTLRFQAGPVRRYSQNTKISCRR